MATTPYHDDVAEGRKPRLWLRLLILILLAFLAGAAATLWTLARWDYAAGYLARLNPAARVAAPAPPRPAAAPPAVAPAAQAQVQAQANATARQVEGLESRIGEIEQRAAAAAGNANRAEGLLVAFAARRALDQGKPLGYIEALLRERFGGIQPQAVATVIGASRQPVTLDTLRAGLAEAAPTLVIEGPKDSMWAALRRELAGLVVVRRGGTASEQPDDRFARARRAVEQGNVDVALAEVARLPGRDNAARWIAQARRYVAARSALDAIETAALLDPKTSPTSPAMPAAPQPDATVPEAPSVKTASPATI